MHLTTSKATSHYNVVQQEFLKAKDYTTFEDYFLRIKLVADTGHLVEVSSRAYGICVLIHHSRQSWVQILKKTYV